MEGKHWDQKSADGTDSGRETDMEVQGNDDSVVWKGDDEFRSRSRERWSALQYRDRGIHDYGRGRSLTHRRDRPFSCSREGAAKENDGGQHVKGGTRGGCSAIVKNAASGFDVGEHGNAPAMSTQVSAMFYITNFPN
jgi:hypothetical protein